MANNPNDIFHQVQHLKQGGSYYKKGIFGNLNPRRIGLFKNNINPKKVSAQITRKHSFEIQDNEQFFVFAVHRPFGDRACRLSFRVDKRWNRGSQQRKSMPHFSLSKAQRPLTINENAINFAQIKNKIHKEEDKRRLRLATEEGTLDRSELKINFILVTTDWELFKSYKRNHHLSQALYFDVDEPNRIKTATEHAIRLLHQDRFSFKDTEAERIRGLIRERREQRETEIANIKSENPAFQETEKELSEAEELQRKKAQELLLEPYALAEAKDKELEQSLYPNLRELWFDYSQEKPLDPALLNFLLIADFLGREIHPSTNTNDRFFIF